MSATYLKELILDCNSFGFFESPYEMPEDPVLRHKQADLYYKLSREFMRLSVLKVLLEARLKELKASMCSPPTRVLSVYLSVFDKPEIELFPNKSLVVSIPVHPLEALSLPFERAAYGEFAIRCWSEAVNALESTTDIPANVFRETLIGFREQDYFIKRCSTQVKIKGSSAKARVHGKISSVESTLYLEVSKNSEVLFERQIWHADDMALWHFFNNKPVVEVDDGKLRVTIPISGVIGFTNDHHAEFDLGDLPETFSATVRK